MRRANERIPEPVAAFVREHYAELGARGCSDAVLERHGFVWHTAPLATWAWRAGLKVRKDAHRQRLRDAWGRNRPWMRLVSSSGLRSGMVPLDEVAAGVGVSAAHALAVLRAGGQRVARDGTRVDPRAAAWLARRLGPRRLARDLREMGWVPLSAYARRLGVTLNEARRMRRQGAWMFLPNVVRQERCKHGRVWYHPVDVEVVLLTRSQPAVGTRAVALAAD